MEREGTPAVTVLRADDDGAMMFVMSAKARDGQAGAPMADAETCVQRDWADVRKQGAKGAPDFGGPEGSLSACGASGWP